MALLLVTDFGISLGSVSGPVDRMKSAKSLKE